MGGGWTGQLMDCFQGGGQICKREGCTQHGSRRGSAALMFYLRMQIGRFQMPHHSSDARYSIGPITGFVLVFLCFSPTSSEHISRY